MKIEMTVEELNSMALGIFVDLCQAWPSSNLMETVYQRACSFADDLFYDAKIKPTLELPRNYITCNVLKWLLGEKEVPVEWTLCWCNKYHYRYKDDLKSVAEPDVFALRTVRAEARQYLDDLERARRAVCNEAKFFRPFLPRELYQFVDDYMLLNIRSHRKLCEFDVRQLLAYGFACGVHTERQRRKARGTKS